MNNKIEDGNSDKIIKEVERTVSTEVKSNKSNSTGMVIALVVLALIALVAIVWGINRSSDSTVAQDQTPVQNTVNNNSGTTTNSDRNNNIGSTDNAGSSAGNNNSVVTDQKHQPPGLYWNELHQRGFNFGSSFSYLTGGFTDAKYGAFYNSDSTKLILFHKKDWFSELNWNPKKCILRTTTSREQMDDVITEIKSDGDNYYVEVDPFGDESGYIIWCYKQNEDLEKYCPPENILAHPNTMVVPRYPKNPKLSSNFRIIEEKPWSEVHLDLADILTGRENVSGKTAGTKNK